MGILTGLGLGKEETLNSLLNKSSAIKGLEHLKTIHSELPVAEVKLSDKEIFQTINYNPTQPLTRTTLLGIAALKEALEQAKINKDTPKRIAFISGTTVGGMEKNEEYYLEFFQNNSKDEYIPLHDCAASTEAIADYFGGFDLITTISTACSSAANAIILGANLIKADIVDIAVVGGTECLSKFHLNGFNTLMILDKEPCKPFDQNRQGLNLGEGAAYLVLEKICSAKERNVEPICKLSGYANTCDAFHQTASSPNGQGAFLSMQRALEYSGLRAKDIDYINAHGTATDNNDSSEATAIKRVFGENPPFVSSTKSFTAHTTSAAGSVEAVISILALTHNFIPANLRFKTPMQDVNLLPVKDTIHSPNLQNVMTNSFGFGGNDSSCIFSKIV